MLTTSYTVLDSGILLATVLTETHSDKAKALVAHLLRANTQLVAPALQHYEFFAVIRKWVHRNALAPGQAMRGLDTLLQYPVVLHLDEALLWRGYELAAEFNRPTSYDSQYLAVAERFQCDFWTVDERLYNAVNGRFPHIHWIGNWPEA